MQPLTELGEGVAFKFEVVDLRTDVITASTFIEGVSSPEEAAQRALGIKVIRSGARGDLVARVYWQASLGSARNMVRVYAKAER